MIIICNYMFIKDIGVLSAFGLFELKWHLLLGSGTSRPPVSLYEVRNHLYLLASLSSISCSSPLVQFGLYLEGKLQVKAAFVNRLSDIEYRIINSSGTGAFSQSPLLCQTGPEGQAAAVICNCIRQLSVNTKSKEKYVDASTKDSFKAESN